MVLRWTTCPHCRKTLNFEVRGGGPLRSKLGAATITACPHCKNPISDGKKEWDHMNIFEKTYEVVLHSFVGLFLIPISFLISLAVVSAVGWVLLYLSLPLNQDLFRKSIIPIGFIFVLYGWKSIIDDFRSSMRRTRELEKGD